MLIATSFMLVGWKVWRSLASVSATSRPAAQAFLAWWLGLGIYVTHLALFSLMASFGLTPYALFLAVRVAAIPMLGIALWGIMTYVAFTYTGNPRVAIATAIIASLSILIFLVELSLGAAGRVLVGPYTATVLGDAGTWTLVANTFYAVPLLSSIIAYGLLLRKVTLAAQRFRIGLVTTAMSLWVIAGFIGETAGRGYASFVLVTVVGVATSAALLMAFRPPARLARWLAARDAARDPLPAAAWSPR